MGVKLVIFDGEGIIYDAKLTVRKFKAEYGNFLKNFGFADEVTVIAPGINAKMNEFQAAYGIVQLKYSTLKFSCAGGISGTAP